MMTGINFQTLRLMMISHALAQGRTTHSKPTGCDLGHWSYHNIFRVGRRLQDARVLAIK